MKKLKLLPILMVAAIVMLFQTTVLAGLADWDDKAADEETNKQLQEQKNELEGIENKSSNNYLESLEVEGYTLSPEFDKQTIEYTIKDVEVKSIKIKAVAEDEKARINGTGDIKLSSGENNIRIDVVAENGTTRTYHIKVNRTSQDEEEPVEEINEIIPNEEVRENKNEAGNEKKGFIFVAIIIGLIIIVAFAKRKK